MMFLSVRTVGQNVTTYIILSKIKALLSVMNLSRTSLKLANQLKEKPTRLLETMNKIQREVPLPLRKMKEELHSCKLYKCGDTTLTAY